MTRNEQKLRKSIFTTLDTIYSACVKTKKKWDPRATHIPVKLYAILIDKAKWKKDDIIKAKSLKAAERDAGLKQINEMNKMLQLMAEGIIEAAKGFGTDTVPLTFIKSLHEKMKENIDIGLGMKPKI